MLRTARNAEPSTMGKNRSTILIAIGAAVFVVGAGLAFLAVRGNDGDSSPQVQTAATVAPKAGQVTTAGAAAPSFEIPPGKQALAIQVDYVRGVAGFAKAGDKVNVFGTLKPGSPPAKGLTSPAAKLILSDVQVLSISAPGATGGGATTVLLALNPTDAEQVVYFQSFEGLYLSLARSDQGVVTTPGRSAGLPF
jgi:hypothetical protein